MISDLFHTVLLPLYPSGYREQFKVFDINGDGMITRKEFRRIMGALGQPVKDAEVAAIWSEVDKNSKF